MCDFDGAKGLLRVGDGGREDFEDGAFRDSAKVSGVDLKTFGTLHAGEEDFVTFWCFSYSEDGEVEAVSFHEGSGLKDAVAAVNDVDSFGEIAVGEGAGSAGDNLENGGGEQSSSGAMGRGHGQFEGGLERLGGIHGDQFAF